MLTFDSERERVGGRVALEVEGAAGVVAAAVPRHALQHQIAPAGQDAHARGRLLQHSNTLQTQLNREIEISIDISIEFLIEFISAV